MLNSIGERIVPYGIPHSTSCYGFYGAEEVMQNLPQFLILPMKLVVPEEMHSEKSEKGQFDLCLFLSTSPSMQMAFCLLVACVRFLDIFTDS